jgi:hypothetical protein
MDDKKEYIERGALLDRNMYGNTTPITHRTYAEQLISSAPVADVVEVVRCKDCKDVKMLVDIIGEPHLFCCNGRSINRMKVKFDDYCSNGERKEE